MAESENILTKLHDLLLYVVPQNNAVAMLGERFRPNGISRFEPLNRSERLLSRPPGTLSSIPNGGEGRGEEALRFMGSFDLQQWTRIGAMNRAEHPSPHPSPLLGGGERVPEGRVRGGSGTGGSWKGRNFGECVERCAGGLQLPRAPVDGKMFHAMRTPTAAASRRHRSEFRMDG